MGEVLAGESSLVIATAGAHRAEAFETCRYILEELKASAPIWKARFEKEENR